MFKRIFFLLSICVCSSTISHAQNKLDGKGKKTGSWVESNGLVEANYINGQKEGAYKQYYKKTHKLKCEGTYHKDLLTGSWKYWDSKGNLFCTVDSIVPNDTLNVTDGHMGQLRPPYRGYLKDYYKDGKVQHEGEALFDDPVAHYYRILMWKFYDKKGVMVKQELFKKPKAM